MGKHRFPRSDAEFLVAMQTLNQYFVEKASSFAGYTSEIASIAGATTSFETALQNQQALENEKQAATVIKNQTRTTVEDEASALIDRLIANGDADAAELENMGLDAPDTQPTTIGVPTTRPIGNVETAQRLEHRIEFVDETSTTTNSRAKPDGVHSCFIYRKIGGTSPVDLTECSFRRPRYRLALSGNLQRRGRGQNRLLHPALGKRQRRTRSTQRNRRGNRYRINRARGENVER